MLFYYMQSLEAISSFVVMLMAHLSNTECSLNIGQD